RMSGAEQTHHFGERGAGSGTVQELDNSQPQLLDASRCGPDACVVSFGEHDAAAGTARPLVHRLAERHRVNFFRSAFCTAGWTSDDTSPPNRATSRTRLELR